MSLIQDDAKRNLSVFYDKSVLYFSPVNDGHGGAFAPSLYTEIKN